MITFIISWFVFGFVFWAIGAFADWYWGEDISVEHLIYLLIALGFGYLLIPVTIWHFFDQNRYSYKYKVLIKGRAQESSE